MSINLKPDIYTPSVDDNGNYIDNKPIINHGLNCPCGTRKDKIYENAYKFATHCKTKSHQKWLSILNKNKSISYYNEMIKNKKLLENQQNKIEQLENELKKLIENQQKKIIYLEIDSQNKSKTIEYLTEKIEENKHFECSAYSYPRD
jgi:hypothetical protein